MALQRRYLAGIGLFLVLFMTSAAVSAQNLLTHTDDFLPHEMAFQVSYTQQGSELTVSWYVVPDYYLYRDQITVSEADGRIIDKGEAQAYTDEFFGKTWIYRDQAEVTIQLTEAAADAGQIAIGYQGCADAGLCYPPIELVVYLKPFTPAAVADGAEPATESGSNLWALLVFIAIGVGLALTPCVLPMYPIISGVVLGGKTTQPVGHSLVLALSYTQGMALTYTGMGILVAMLGAQFQAYLQHPVVIGVIALLFILLALAMFGVFNIQLPQSVVSRLHAVKVTGGRVTGAFIIGVLSGLVASPCTTAPLSGVLLYIAQTGDMVQGGLSLYALALGMSVPLILFVLGGQKLIPKTGAWMRSVKIIFGLALLGVAVMFIERLISVTAANYLWIAFAGATTVIVAGELKKHLRGGVKYLVIIPVYLIGITIIASFLGANKAGLKFTEVESQSGIVDITTQYPTKLVLVDLYADWCVACKEFERYTFTDSDVMTFVSEHDIQLVKIDMTAMNDEAKRIMRAYDVIGLPTLLLLRDNKEVGRITGYQGPEDFIQSLEWHVD